jgi:hypothetical protein
MNDRHPTNEHAVSTEQRDRLLRRLIAVFVVAAAAAFVAAIGTSAWGDESVRANLAQQQISVPAAR